MPHALRQRRKAKFQDEMKDPALSAENKQGITEAWIVNLENLKKVRKHNPT